MPNSVLLHIQGHLPGVKAPLDWEIKTNEHWLIQSKESRTSSLLCQILADEIPPPASLHLSHAPALDSRRTLVSFTQQRACAQAGGFRQARYHSLVDEAGPGETVEEFLSFNRIFDVNPFEVGVSYRAPRAAYRRALTRMVRLFRLSSLFKQPLLSLSNGETRRVLLAHALLHNPRLLVLEDPCAGLDPAQRAHVKSVCEALANRALSLVLVVRHADEIPSCLTHTVKLSRTSVQIKELVHASSTPSAADATHVASQHPLRFETAHGAPFVVELKHIHLAFGSRVLLKDFTWRIRAGEHWVLRGANGSGKTTLLSLVTGDNPQAYAQDVTVFGHARGAPGVELAQIRRKIGMVSPELQAFEGLGAEELLAQALVPNLSLLLLDEPCLNLSAPASRRLKQKVVSYLKKYPQCAAICVAHRAEDIPATFNLSLSL